MGFDQKITVCHLISGDLWAGAEVQTHTLLSSLKDEPGLNLSAVVLNEARLAAELRKTGVETIVIDESSHSFTEIRKRLLKELEHKNIDILHSHRYKENLLAAQVKKHGLCRCLVQTVHGTGERFKGIDRIKISLYNYLNRRVTRKHFDRVIAVSKDLKNQLTESYSEDRVVTIHNGVNRRRLQPSRGAAEIRRELGIAENRPVLGTAGRMVPVKGYDLLLKAADYIVEDNPQVMFVIAGDGPLKAELEQQATAAGLKNNVKFIGFREDIIDILNCLDIFVMSSHHEGIPMVLLEAMALQKPVVSTAVGGIREIIQDNISGLLVKPGDFKSLALACLIMLNRPDTRTQLSLGAVKRIREEFSVEVQKERILKLYRQALEPS
ncbi:MAG: glycosyltransferase family 4 protein [Candidatus Zixiibacteriota bacterium]